jgi:hypothetical protein
MLLAVPVYTLNGSVFRRTRSQYLGLLCSVGGGNGSGCVAAVVEALEWEAAASSLHSDCCCFLTLRLFVPIHEEKYHRNVDKMPMVLLLCDIATVDDRFFISQVATTSIEIICK